jgi:hypothetical protein
VLAVLAAATARPRVAAGDTEVASEHVRVRGELDHATLRSFADLAEAVYPQWRAYFGAEPKKSWLPLDLRVLRDRDSFLAALRGVGVSGSMAGAGGYYDPGTRTSYLYPQPHTSSTRLLVLHELTHQFQYKAVQDNRGERSPVWHKEGLAEHFGFHRRTKTGVETGVLDVVAIDARPVEFAARYRAGTFDPWAIGTGARANVDYTDSLGMVETFLRTSDEGLRDLFHEWERDVFRGADAGRHFEKTFRGKKERIERAAREVWGDWKRTWKIVYVAWDEEPGAIVAKGMPWAVLQGVSPQVPGKAAIEAEVTLSADAAAGGVSLGLQGVDDLVVFEVRPGGVLRLAQKKGGAWRDLGGASSPSTTVGVPVRLRLALVGTDLVAEAGGAPAMRVPILDAGLLPSDLEGPAGLLAEAGEVRFADVRTGG